MTGKEIFLNFINETENKPYFSTLYDLDMWKEDKEKIANDLEVLEILKKYLKIDENYYSQDNGSTEAIKLCISNCVSVEEDEEYTDECYPNYDYYKVKEWLKNGKINY